MTDTINNSLVLFEPKALDIVLDEVRSIAVMKPEDSKFLVEHKEHLTAVMEKTFMWRTSTQKRSIINDNYHKLAGACLFGNLRRFDDNPGNILR